MVITYDGIITKINSLLIPPDYNNQLWKMNPSFSSISIQEMDHYLQRIGYKPEDFDQLQIIHVAGTKGKGSTCALTQSILHHYPLDKPLKIGLLTSPHIISFRERFRINDKLISEALFTKYANEVWNQLENTKDQAIDYHKILFDLNSNKSDNDDHLTYKPRNHPDKPFFCRFLNLLAFYIFMQEKVDVVILEVGFGGEYDRTNFIEKPIVCGITSLGLDHTDVLGNTIDQIAWHKAGIIKNGRPVFSIEQPEIALEVIKRRAKEKNAPLKVINYSQAEQLNNVEIGLAGACQRYNALIAISLAKTWLKECRGIQFKEDEVVPEKFIEGLKKVIWPGRTQTLPNDQTKYTSKIIHSSSLTWYIDVSHTMDSVRFCAKWFKDTVSNDLDDDRHALRVLVFNGAKGRNSPEFLKIFSQLQNTSTAAFDHIVFSTNNTYRHGFSKDNVYHDYISIDDAHAYHITLADYWLQYVPDFNKRNIHMTRSVQETIDWVVDYANQNQNQNLKIQVLVTGSFYLAGNTLAGR
ncbi:unnamed protein product [Cunninghamella blakesleeana]